MATQQYLLSDMDFFVMCEEKNVILNEANLLVKDDGLCKKDIHQFINQMIDGESYTVYCLESPPEYLMYLIVQYVEFQQMALKAGTPKSLIPDLNCFFEDAMGNVREIYSS
jgi:hypothetical protein|tara:strand:+ start:249 stop:581 length:333 start_codon:yes stop_codon:yes gene_type:complete